MRRKKPYLSLGVIILVMSVMFFQVCVSAQENKNSHTAANNSTCVASTGSDTVPPTVPKELTVINKTYTSISLKWATSSDKIGVRGYEVYRDGKKIITTKKTNYTNTSLIPGRNYTYSIKAYDAAGNISDSSSSLTVSTFSDKQAPTAPKNLSPSSATHTTISLTWEPSIDNIGIKSYVIYCSGKRIASTSATYYICKKLSPGTTYTFNIRAYDISGNYSIESNNCSGETIVDTTAPSVPSKLKISSVSETEVNLTWSPSSDNVKVKGYEVFRDGKSIGTTGKTSLKNGSLIPGKSYTYTVRAYDSSDNISGMSFQLKTKTLNDLKPPQAPTALTAAASSKSSVSLKWQASTDDVKIKGYIIYCNGLKVATTTRTSYTVKGLSNLGFAVFYVKAYDLAENLSDCSNNKVIIFIN